MGRGIKCLSGEASLLPMETELPSQMTGVYLPSAIVENMAEFRPEMCTEAAQQGLLQWLLKRLKVSWLCGTTAQTSLLWPGLLLGHWCASSPPGSMI